jgi:hypothetical protein
VLYARVANSAVIILYSPTDYKFRAPRLPVTLENWRFYRYKVNDLPGHSREDATCEITEQLKSQMRRGYEWGWGEEEFESKRDESSELQIKERRGKCGIPGLGPRDFLEVGGDGWCSARA